MPHGESTVNGAFSSSRTTHRQCVTRSLYFCASHIAPVSMHRRAEALAHSSATLVKKLPCAVWTIPTPPQPVGKRF